MNHHDRLKENIFALYDEQLPNDLRPGTEAHLQDCRECREDLEGWKQSKTLFIEPLLVKSTEQHVLRIMRNLRTYEPHEKWMRWFRGSVFVRWAVPALGLSMAGFTLALYLSLQPVEPYTDTLILEGHAANLTAEWQSSLADDRILDLLETKP